MHSIEKRKEVVMKTDGFGGPRIDFEVCVFALSLCLLLCIPQSSIGQESETAEYEPVDSSACADCHVENNVMPQSHGPGWALWEVGGRHADEARRDLASCISCHEDNAEELCITCHVDP